MAASKVPGENGFTGYLQIFYSGIGGGIVGLLIGLWDWGKETGGVSGGSFVPLQDLVFRILGCTVLGVVSGAFIAHWILISRKRG